MVNVNLPRGENQTHVLQACFNEAQKPGLDKAHMVDFKNNLLKSLWQPAKAPSRPPACKGSLMAKTMLCMQRLLTKQLLPKGCEAVGVGLHGVVGQEKKHCSQSGPNPHAHDHLTACKQHTAYTKPKQKLHTHTHATLTQTHATTHTTKTQMHRAYKIQT